jgi:hypothetical protein
MSGHKPAGQLAGKRFTIDPLVMNPQREEVAFGSLIGVRFLLGIRLL